MSRTGLRTEKGLKYEYSAKSPEVVHICREDPVLANIVSKHGSLDVSLAEDLFPFCVHIVVEQLMSVAAANTVYKRLEEVCAEAGGAVDPDTILSLPEGAMRECGLSAMKEHAIFSLAELAEDGNLDAVELDSMEDDEIAKRLTTIKGIGPWTAKMVLTFAFGREDLLPVEDLALMRAYKQAYDSPDATKADLAETAEKWVPYRGLAVRYLYRTLEEDEPEAGAK